jgi:hypothetical protein
VSFCDELALRKPMCYSVGGGFVVNEKTKGALGPMHIAISA